VRFFSVLASGLPIFQCVLFRRTKYNYLPVAGYGFWSEVDGGRKARFPSLSAIVPSAKSSYSAAVRGEASWRCQGSRTSSPSLGALRRSQRHGTPLLPAAGNKAACLNGRDKIDLDVETPVPSRDVNEDPGRRVFGKKASVDFVYCREHVDGRGVDVHLEDL
jgi:hypothetical protein